MAGANHGDVKLSGVKLGHEKILSVGDRLDLGAAHQPIHGDIIEISDSQQNAMPKEAPA